MIVTLPFTNLDPSNLSALYLLFALHKHSVRSMVCKSAQLHLTYLKFWVNWPPLERNRRF